MWSPTSLRTKRIRSFRKFCLLPPKKLFRQHRSGPDDVRADSNVRSLISTVQICRSANGRCCRKTRFLSRFWLRGVGAAQFPVLRVWGSWLGTRAGGHRRFYTSARSDGGPSSWSAMVFRFCTMAARWNSSRAPQRPRSRIRSKPWWVFKCAKRISTRFL